MASLNIPVSTGPTLGFYRQLIAKIEALENEVAALKNASAAIPPQPPFLDVVPATMDPLTLTSNLTMDAYDLNKNHLFNCTTAATVTLPDPGEEAWMSFHNVGTKVITLQTSGAVTVAALGQQEEIRVCSMNISGTWEWCKKMMKMGHNGYVFQDQPIVLEKNGSGIIFKGDEATAHWYRLTVVAGVLTLTDTGTTVFDGATAVVTT